MILQNISLGRSLKIVKVWINVICAHDMIAAERAGRSSYETEPGKYSDAISHTMSIQTKKQLSLYLNHYTW